MIKVYELTNEQKDKYLEAEKSVKQFPRVISQLNRTTSGFTLKMEGPEDELNSFINSLEQMGFDFE
jgi:hypothetical protein